MSNKDSGFLKLYRTFFDHFLWDEEREFSKAEAWIDLLQTARYKEGRSTEMINGQVVEWERGELLASVRFLKNRWNWNSTGKVTRFLEMLEKQNMVIKKTEQGVTIISICKYNSYNPIENDDGTPTEHERNSDGTVTEQQQVQNRKKVKKVKNDKNGHSPPEFSEVKKYFSQKGFSPQLAQKFYNYYNEPMMDRNGRVWKDQNGKTVKSWKQKALAVWMKDDNKKDQSAQVFDGGLW